MSAERSLLFADGRFAVLSQAQDPGDTALILFNAGYIHRPGPFRLHVGLCRRWAEAGYPSLRIDQPGVVEALCSAARPQLDLARELLDRMQAETGCTRFVVGGICAAADFGWQLALRDERISGLILLDPLARREALAFRLGQLQLLLARGPQAWWDMLRRRLGGRRAAPAATDADLRDWSPVGSESAQLEALTARGVELFVLYTGGAASYFTHPAQFFRGYGPASRSERVSFHYWRQCDHMFFKPDDREQLMHSLSAWRDARLGAAS